MKKHASLALVAAAFAAGCLGSDPNMNSIYLHPPATGGATGSAGTTGSGGGTTGGGGTGPSVTGPIVGGAIAKFDIANEGFQLNTYHDMSLTNLGDPASSASPTLSFDATEGSPQPGAIKVVAPYTGANQYVDIQKNMMAAPQNWTGRTMHVRLKVAEGSFGGGAQVYAITVPGSYFFGGTFTNVAKNNNWQEFTVNIDTPMTAIGGYDPKQVIIFGIQLSTGSMGAGTGTVTFLLDSFSLDPPLAGSTGTGGTTGAAGSGGASGNAGAGGTTGTAGSSADASAGG